MLHAKLVREIFCVNVKVVERIYREERLWLRHTKRKEISREGRGRAWCSIAPNQRWFSTSAVTRWPMAKSYAQAIADKQERDVK